MYVRRKARGVGEYDQPSSPFLPGVVPQPPQAYSEETAQSIAAEVRAMVARAHERVHHLLGEQQAILQRLARRLEKEVLEGAELQALLTPEPVAPTALALG